jgi:Arc/MetJ-type ribon-helix-helix transcriptional regulator
MTETIPVRLDRETIDTLDLLVKTGLYRNRSEAIRELIKRGLDSQEELKKLGKLVKMIETMDSDGKLNFAGVKLDREFRNTFLKFPEAFERYSSLLSPRRAAKNRETTHSHTQSTKL